VSAHDIGHAIGQRILGAHRHQRPTAPDCFGVEAGILFRHADMRQAANQSSGCCADSGAGKRRDDWACRNNRTDARDRKASDAGDQPRGAADRASCERAFAGGGRCVTRLTSGRAAPL